ncbi:MAG: hypothetical protein Q9168_006371 [Polycauliona sp. 1 TL-2023]
MHSLSIALFAVGALAGNLKLNQLVPRELQVRQDSEAFSPTTSFGSGATCGDAFGAGFIDCNGVCYNPNEQQTCCPGGGDGYPCPAESFCLNVNGLCCPDGLSTASCAAQFGVQVPDKSATAASTGSTVAHSSTISAVESSITDTSSGFVPSTTATTLATPYPTGANATSAAPTATGTGTGSAGESPAPFMGAGSSLQVGLAAGLMGVVAMLL